MGTTDKGAEVLLVDTLSATNDYSVELALALAERVSLTVVTVETTELCAGPSLDVLPIFPRYGGGGARWRKVLGAVRGTLSLAHALWRHRDVTVHAQFMRFPLLELPLYLLLRPWLRSLVITVHNYLPHERRNWQSAFYLRWYRLANRLHVLSHHVGQQLTEHLNIPSDRIDVIPHGNYRRFKARHSGHADLVRLGVAALADPNAVVIGFFGLIRPYKGVPHLARAFARIESHDVVLVIAGKVEESARAGMAEVATLLTDDHRYHLVPRFLDESELAALLARADILVFPYTDISQSGALMLAMTYGKAVVTNNIAGFREYLQDGETGLLCDTTNATAFAAALERLITDPGYRLALGRRAGEEMETRFGWATIADAMIACYRRAQDQA